MSNGSARPAWQHNVKQVEYAADTVLDTVSRVASAVLVLLLIGICVFACWFRSKYLSKFHAVDDGHKSSSWTRWHKIKEAVYNFCCCGVCCHPIYRRMGFDVLQAGRTLRVTLLQATKIKKQMDVYFEVWSEPAEDYPKNSRVHHRAVGTCSLGGEQLELDWYGDEDEVVLQAVRFSSVQGRDLPFAELKVPRSYVERYAREASNDPKDAKRGARAFSLRGLSEHEQKLRSLRFKPKAKAISGADAVPLLPSAFHNSLEEQGLALVPLEEAEKVKEARASTVSGLSSLPQSSHATTEAHEVPMEVALRFEFVQPEQMLTQANSFRSSSFQLKT